MSELTRESTNPVEGEPDLPTLEKLRSIWEDALEKGIEDETQSFFDNGGESLGTTVVLTRIRQEFGVELSLEDFFNHPTLYDLFELIERCRGVSK